MRVPRVMPALRAAAARTYADEAAATGLSLSFTSPAAAYYTDKVVHQVNVPGLTGGMGILANHVPVLTCLAPGVVSVYETADTAKNYFVSSGTISVNSDSTVHIIAEEAVPVEDLDISAARAGLDAANAKLGSADPLEKAEAEIAAEVHAAMVKALE